MPNQVRVAKVLAILLASMTGGAVLLMASGHNPPSAGPFSLWTYCRLDPVKDAVRARSVQPPVSWNRIEIYYSGTRGGNIEQLATIEGLSNSGDLNCHFCLCNGLGGVDGQIQVTERWQKQLPVASNHTWYGGNRTIGICVIGDVKMSGPTDCQIKRAQLLVEELCRRFPIKPDNVYYPGDWH